MAKILVTGGAGFIGSHLCEALLLRGDEVVAIDNFDPFYPEETKRRNLRAIDASALFRFYENDIRDESSLNTIFSDEMPDVVIHLAARAGVRDSIATPKVYIDINVNGTLNVLEAMRKHRVMKLIFASSSSVYGGVTETPFRETQPVVPLSPYAASKVAGEALCSSYSATSGLSVFCCRFFTVYGPRQRPDMAISRFAALMASGQTVTVFGDGSSARDYTFVDDIVRGLLSAIDTHCRYEIVNLGSTRLIPLMHVIEILSRYLGIKPDIRYLPLQAGEPLVTLADILVAARLLGYSPSTDFEDGVRQFAMWAAREPQNVLVSA